MFKRFSIFLLMLCFLPLLVSADVTKNLEDAKKIISDAKYSLGYFDFNGEIEFAEQSSSLEYRKWVWYIGHALDDVILMGREINKKSEKTQIDWEYIGEIASRVEKNLSVSSYSLKFLLDNQMIKFKWLSIEFAFKDILENLNVAEGLMEDIKLEASIQSPVL